MDKLLSFNELGLDIWRLLWLDIKGTIPYWLS